MFYNELYPILKVCKSNYKLVPAEVISIIEKQVLEVLKNLNLQEESDLIKRLECMIKIISHQIISESYKEMSNPAKTIHYLLYVFKGQLYLEAKANVIKRVY